MEILMLVFSYRKFELWMSWYSIIGYEIQHDKGNPEFLNPCDDGIHTPNPSSLLMVLRAYIGNISPTFIMDKILVAAQSKI